ncbi:hypothetical protein BDZ89DRAFT_1154657 [Hymenopellis radicata]|nr:hypothetical protein BDZ89DRAFT_1154657 [Hymenopellis radicata]
MTVNVNDGGTYGFSLSNYSEDPLYVWNSSSRGLTDEADVETVQELARIVMDALRHPHRPRPSGESVVGEIARQFWERAIRTASRTSVKRFIDTFDAYVESVVDQAKDRSDDRIRTIADYMELRRITIGGKPSFALLELGMDLPGTR